MPAEVVTLLFSWTFFFLLGFMFWVSKRAKAEQSRNAARLEIQTRMLDKFGTAGDFVEFVNSPAGQSFLEPANAPAAKLNPLMKFYQSLRWGSVLSLVGLGFIVLSVLFEEAMLVPGVLFLTLGLGFLVSGFISQRLARSWGLIDTSHPPALREPAHIDG